MACPLFLPDCSLGGYYSGHCSANADTVISTDMLRLYCNRGYARAICAEAATAEADASQFLIKSDRGGTVEVAWSLERNHHPVAVGVMTISPDQTGTDPMQAQAAALVSAYLINKTT